MPIIYKGKKIKSAAIILGGSNRQSRRNSLGRINLGQISNTNLPPKTLKMVIVPRNGSYKPCASAFNKLLDEVDNTNAQGPKIDVIQYGIREARTFAREGNFPAAFQLFLNARDLLQKIKEEDIVERIRR